MQRSERNLCNFAPICILEMLPIIILAPGYQPPASRSNEQDTCNSLKTTGKQLRANLSAWTQALLRCSSQPSRSYSAQHTTSDCAKSGRACEPDLCACFCEYLPCNYPFSHDRALVQTNTAHNMQRMPPKVTYWHALDLGFFFSSSSTIGILIPKARWSAAGLWLV